MARHFRKNGKLDGILKLLLLLLLTASVILLAGSFIFRDRDQGQPPAVSEKDLNQEEQPKPDASQPDVSAEPGEETEPEREPEAGSKPVPDLGVTLADGEKPLLAIIVDDGGNQMELTKRIAATNLPLTWAIIPYTRHASETAELAESKGIPYLVHLPMQALSDKDGNGEYVVGRGLTAGQIREITGKALDSLPGAIGLNNHRGSLATSSVEIMEPVIYELKERGRIFVDSRTSEKSVAYNVAIINGVPALRNRGFLDGSPAKSEIEKRFNEIVKLAAKRGDAIVICHFRPTTVTFLESLAGKKDALPVRLVTIPEMQERLKKRSY